MNTKEFIDRLKCILGDNYSFIKTKFINYDCDVIITCKEHGDFLINPINVLYHDSICPECAKVRMSKNKTLTTKQFIQKAKKIHGEKYNYSLVHYLNYETKVKIICPEHGIFEQTPNNHLKGCGCKLCNSNKS